MEVDQLKHKALQEWILKWEKHFEPSDVYVCDGSEQEHHRLAGELVKSGAFIKLDENKRPGSYWCASDPNDVARVEERTFICSKDPKDAGPTNNHKDPQIMHEELNKISKGCMKGRTMYVVPFCMGPLKAPLAMVGVQLSDSPYVACNTRTMTRMGQQVLDKMGSDGEFIPCLHSVGVPLQEGTKDSFWPCAPEDVVVSHFPEEKQIFSYGSGYGGNALLGKKCLALRIASVKAKEEKWLAEHMLIIKLTSPEGESKFIAGSFPSACGKTNLAMLQPSLPGWKVECVGDDIAWMKVGKDGRLYAINPEAGFFGVAPGTSEKSNPNCMRAIEKNTIFTNVGLTEDGDVWWEGMTDEPPKMKMDWKRRAWDPSSKEKVAHPNSRFTAHATECPILAKEFDDAEGVPIDAIIFGGRRKSLVPLVYESLSWEHGVFVGASLSSEMTAAVKGTVGKLRHDPFSMIAFCGYNMGDYFGHWLDFAQFTDRSKLPKIFNVNWFRQDESGKFMWPGFGENSRVLKWIFERCSGDAKAEMTPIGNVPHMEDFELSGLDISKQEMEELLKIDNDGWLKEMDELENYFAMFKEAMPKALLNELNEIRKRLKDAGITSASKAS